MGMEIVGVSDIRTSQDVNDVLITYSLGSCIGLTAYDPEAKVGGMIHYMLPLSKVAPEKARNKPGMFADTGVTLLLRKVLSMGANKSRLILKVAGGSQLMDQNKVFNIGERNFLVLRKILWKNNLLIDNTDVGGNLARTMRLEINTGRVTIKSSKGVMEL